MILFKEYISKVTDYFKDKRVVDKTEIFFSKSLTTQDNKIMDN